MHRRILATLLLVLPVTALSGGVQGAGIDCRATAEWSRDIDGFQLNLHHVFCGEAGRGDRAKGFHAMPHGQAPSSYVTSTPADAPNAAGVYTLRDIGLKFDGAQYTKRFSSVFPNACSALQVAYSIIYSRQHSTGNCAAPGWAQCGPSGPAADSPDKAGYCLGDDGKPFPIASALLPNSQKINTGFPIFERR